MNHIDIFLLLDTGLKSLLEKKENIPNKYMK